MLPSDMPEEWRRVFEHRVEVDANGCWLWTGNCFSVGYARINVNRRGRTGHRLSWELSTGPIPDGGGYHGTCVCHRCDVRRCVNPEHLFLGTPAENMHDRDRKGRHGRGYSIPPEHRSRGVSHHQARLSELDVIALRSARANTGESYTKLAARFGISARHARDICTRQRWSHI